METDMREHQNELVDYLNGLCPADSPSAQKAKEEALRLNKQGISIAPYEAHLLGFFIRLLKCKKFVELGSLTGYSGLSILNTLPADGHLWTIEYDPFHAAMAKRVFEESGFQSKVTVLVGRAEDQLPLLTTQGPFDGIFIDANKAAYPSYLDWSLENIKSGGLILADNTLLKGVVPQKSLEETNSNAPSKIIKNLRIFNERLADRSLFDSILIPTFEGLTVALKK